MALGEKRCHRCTTIKPLSSFVKNRARHDGVSTYCRQCEAIEKCRYRERHREKVRAYHAANYIAKREAIRARNDEWAKKNPERRALICSEWARNNAARVQAKVAARRAMKLKATPKWADQDKIRAIYAEARRLTKETGIQHEVDHIFPLKGDVAQGLHVQYNLQILTMTENRHKWKHMPGTLC